MKFNVKTLNSFVIYHKKKKILLILPKESFKHIPLALYFDWRALNCSTKKKKPSNWLVLRYTPKNIDEKNFHSHHINWRV